MSETQLDSIITLLSISGCLLVILNVTLFFVRFDLQRISREIAKRR